MKKNILLIIIGVLIGSIGVYASTLINSNQVSYKDTTVDLALDDLITSLDTINSSGNATAAQILKGKTAYVKGSLITGSMANKSGSTVEATTLTTDDDYAYINIPSNGYYSTTSKVKMAANLVGNSNLRFDEESGYIQAINDNGQWQNVYKTNSLPIDSWNGVIFENGEFTSIYGTDYFASNYLQKENVSNEGSYTPGASIINGKLRITLPTGTTSSRSGTVFLLPQINLTDIYSKGFRYLNISYTEVGTNFGSVVFADEIKNGWNCLGSIGYLEYQKGLSKYEISELGTGYIVFYIGLSQYTTGTQIDITKIWFS